MSKSNKPNEQDILFTVNGFEVRKDSTYVIRHKPDLSAPSGFQREAATKLPSDDIDDSFQCRYIRRGGGNQGVWDTGFFEYSPCYEGQSESIVKNEIKQLKTNLVDPYCKAAGDKTALSEENDAAWMKRRFRIFESQVLNTNDPFDRLTIYFALRTYQVTPKGQEGDPKYRDAAYVIVDTTKNLRLKDERASNKFAAMGEFYSLLNTDKPKLFAILKYLNFSFSETTPDQTLMGMFDEWITPTVGSDRVKDFNRIVEEAATDLGYDKLQVYSALKAISLKKHGKISKAPNGKFFYQDFEIGADLKQAAENIARDNNLVHVKKELLLTDDE